MKVHCVGSRFFGSQIERIEQGFVELGHELTPHIHEAALVYVNDSSHYDQPIADKTDGILSGKLILNVLDIPLHIIHEFDTDKLRRQLLVADAVTSISFWTQGQVAEKCGIVSSVIWNPIKPITRDPNPRFNVGPEALFLSAARRSDPNKRFPLGVAALQMLGVTPNRLALVGSDPFPWGHYLGVLNDHGLNNVYNTVDFVFSLGRIEGLSLNCPEGMAAGIIPIVCNDMTTRKEFLPPEVFPEYGDVDPTPVSVAKFVARYINNSEVMAEMKDRLHNHYQKNWSYLLSGQGVAQSILNIYQSIV